MSGQSSSPIARAVAELETERQNLQARLGKVDEAIASLRALFHLPADRTPTTTPDRNTKGPAAEHRSSKGDKVRDAISAALKGGELSSMDLAVKVGLNKSTVGYHVRQMKADGVVRFLGAGKTTTVALAGGAAKEGL